MSTEALEEAAAVQAAAAHEAGRAEAAAEGAAADAQEAAQVAQAAAADARWTAEDLATIVTTALAPLVARLDDLEARTATTHNTAIEAVVIAEEAADLAEEPVVVVAEAEEVPAAVVVEEAPDTGLVVATEENPRVESPQARQKKYRRI